MDSFFARNRLSAYLDGELSEPEASEVAGAIEADPALRAEYESLRRAINLLRKAGPVKAPPGFHARIMERVRDEPHPGGIVIRLQRVFQRVPMEAVALAAAAAIVLMVVQARSERPGNEDARTAQEDRQRNTDRSILHGKQGPDAKVAPSSNGSAHLDPFSGDSLDGRSIVNPASAGTDGAAALDGVQHLEITSYDPEILNKVARLIEEIGVDAGIFHASEADMEASPLQAQTMSDQYDFQRAFLTMPADRQAEVRSALEKLNAKTPKAGAPYIEQGLLPSATQAVILLDLTYIPPM